MPAPKDILFLSLEDVLACGVKDMALARQNVFSGFQKLAAKELTTPYKTSLCPCGSEHQEGLVNVLSCFVNLESEDVFGFKVIGSSPRKRSKGYPRATGLLLLYEADSKEPICIMDAQAISAMRTGAVTSLAVDRLVPPETDTVSLIGAGINMRTQLLGIVHALPNLRQIRVWSRSDSHKIFAQEMASSAPCPIIPINSVEEATQGSRFIVTCLGSVPEPRVLSHHIPTGGVSLFNIGGTEFEPRILSTMDRIVADLWDHAQHRKNQTHAVAHHKEYITSEEVENLAPILTGDRPGRTDPNQRIFFCPTGLCFEDTLLGWRIYQEACRKNIGNRFRLWQTTKWI